jgi:hypothetical protein
MYYLMFHQRTDCLQPSRLKKVQSKKKRDTASRNAPKLEEPPSIIDDSDNTAPVNLLSSKDADVIF